MGLCRFLRKLKLRKMLIRSFNNLDISEIKLAIVDLMDFDSQYRTNKLGKYIQRIIYENPQLNEKMVLMALRDFKYIEKIFDEPMEEEIKDENILDEKIKIIEQKRKEILIRKNQLKLSMIGKQKKMNKRKVGGLG